MASYPTYLNISLRAESVVRLAPNTLPDLEAQYLGRNVPAKADLVLHQLAQRLLAMESDGEDMTRVDLPQMLRSSDPETQEVYNALRVALGINDSNSMDYDKQNYTQFVRDLMNVVNQEESRV